MLHHMISKLGIISAIMGLVSSVLLAENLTLNLSSKDYSIVELEDGQQTIQMEDFGYLLDPGKPLLPAKVFMIALPPGAEVLNAAITGMSPIELPGTYRIEPAPPIVPSDNRRELVKRLIREWKENYDATYSSDQIYPEKVGEYLGPGGLRKYTFAKISFFPFAFRPVSGKLVYYPSAIVSIDYTLPLSDNSKALEVGRLLSDTLGDDRASRLLVNFSQASRWYAPEKRDEVQNTTYDYVIITTPELEDAVEPLMKWKQGIGFSVKVITIAWIDENYTGFDMAEMIRNFLKDKYPASEWGIQYVLIVGDISDIPMRYCFPDPDNHVFTPDDLYDNAYISGEVPTDYYYADLTGNWDSDGDGYYGEFRQDEEVDFVSEVWIGRIPLSDWLTVNNICKKIALFESDVGSWKNNALLLGAITFYNFEDGDPHYSKTDEAGVMEDMKTFLLEGWNCTRMYEKDGLDPSSFTCETPLTQDNVVSYWSTNQYGIVTWSSHGWVNNAARVVWEQDNGNGFPEWAEDELHGYPFIENANTASLDDDYPSIVFGSACMNSYPEVDNLGTRLLERGSSSIVAATRAVAGPFGRQHKDVGGNISCNYYFFHYLISEENKVGEALFNSKNYYHDHFLSSGFWDYQNLYANCLYGDPALVREGIPKDSQSLTILNNFMPPAFVGFAYSEPLLAVGGTPPYHWNLTDGSLPDGISLDTLSGVILGTPTVVETTTFTIEVTDAEHKTDFQDFSMTTSIGKKGDVNADMQINAVDMLQAVNILTRSYSPTHFEMWAADCNGPVGNCDGDGVINVLDIVKFVRFILTLEECP